jgi:nicotinamide riboside transporter PnuC
MFQPTAIEVAALVLVSRIADLGSTYLATPKLKLEANDLMRAAGWRLGLLFSILFVAIPFYNVGLGVMTATMFFFAAASNFSGAWMAHSLGEDEYLALMHRAARTSSRRVVERFIAASAVCWAIIGATVMMTSVAAAPLAFWAGAGMVISAFTTGIVRSDFMVRIFKKNQVAHFDNPA